MAYAMFTVRSLMPPQYVSIKEAAEIVVDRLVLISAFQQSAMQPTFLSESGNVELDIDNMGTEAAKIRLSEWFLKDNRAEIKADIGQDVVSVDVKRRLGWSGAILINDDGKELFSMLFHIGGTHPYFLIRRLKRGQNKNYKWYKQLLVSLVDEQGQNPALSGGVTINSGLIYDKFDRGSVEFVLGWMNYFSDSFPVNLPQNIDIYRIKRTKRGKYLTLTGDDITDSKEVFESYCDQVIDCMEKMKEDQYYGSGDSHPALKRLREEYMKSYPLYEVPGIKLSHTGKLLD